MPVPPPAVVGTAALLAAGTGYFYAQSGLNIWMTLLQAAIAAVAAALGGGGLVALAKIWADVKTNNDRHEREMTALKADHRRQMDEVLANNQVLKKEIEDGARERKRMQEEHVVERDILLIQVQDLKLGEAWLHIQLRQATGNEIPPKPPLFTPEAEKALNQSGFHFMPGEIPRGRDVLIIDDSPDTVVQMKRLLRYYGWVVRSAAGVPQALYMIKERTPDIILTDLVMPGQSGAELVRQVQADGNMRTRLIVLTGYPDHELVRQVRELGVEVLQKPIDFERLLHLITPVEFDDEPSGSFPPAPRT